MERNGKPTGLKAFWTCPFTSGYVLAVIAQIRNKGKAEEHLLFI
jgi:hypothetical protein